MNRPVCRRNLFFAMACLALAVGGGMLLMPTVFSYENVKSRMDSYSNHGLCEALTPAMYARAMTASRLMGGSLIVVVLTLMARRRQAAKAWGAFKSAIRSSWPSLAAYAKSLAPDRFIGVLLLAAIVLAVVVRVCFLWQPIRSDEAYTFLTYAPKPLYVAAGIYVAPNHHVFHTLLQCSICYVFGEGLWAIRLPALLAGILIVPAAYAAGCAMYNRTAGALAACLSAASEPLVEYSTNARGYSLVTLLFLVLLILAPLLRRPHQWTAWGLFTLTAGIGFYTIPIMLYPYTTVMLWLLTACWTSGMTAHERNKFLATWLASGLATFLLTVLFYSPILLISGAKSILANEYVRPLSWSMYCLKLPASFSDVWRSWNWGLPSGIVLLLAIGAAISLVFHRKLAQDRCPIVLVAIVACVGETAVHRVVPPLRTWVFLVPLYFIMASAGIAWLIDSAGKRSPAAGRLVLVAAALLAAGWPGWNVLRAETLANVLDTGVFPDAASIAEALQKQSQAGDGVIATPYPSTCPLAYYLRQRGIAAKCLFGKSSSGRWFIVVNRAAAETLPFVLQRAGKAFPGSLKRVEVVEEFPSATLYRLQAGTTDRADNG